MFLAVELKKSSAVNGDNILLICIVKTLRSSASLREKVNL